MARGRRRSVKRSPAAELFLDLSLFRYFQRVINLDAEIAHGAFQFGMPQQQLHRSEFFVRL